MAAAILTIPSNTEIVPAIAQRLGQAQKLYDRGERPQTDLTINKSLISSDTIDQLKVLPTLNDQSGKVRAARTAELEQEAAKRADEPLTKQEATKVWDKLQSRGCCGLKNATEEWVVDNRLSLPKSCCSNATESSGLFLCETVDSDHKRACMDIIQSPSINLSIILALIALVNLFLATVSGISTYRTFHYSEASQNAYS